jgi:hypothetical protein
MLPSNPVLCSASEVVILEEQEQDDSLSLPQMPQCLERPSNPEYGEVQAEGLKKLHSELDYNSPSPETDSCAGLLHSVTVRSVLEHAIDDESSAVAARGYLQPRDISTSESMATLTSREKQLSSATDDEARYLSSLYKSHHRCDILTGCPVHRCTHSINRQLFCKPGRTCKPCQYLST